MGKRETIASEEAIDRGIEILTHWDGNFQSPKDAVMSIFQLVLETPGSTREQTDAISCVPPKFP